MQRRNALRDYARHRPQPIPQSTDSAIMRKGRNLERKVEFLGLNVKDPEAHRLAKAIAHETGESLTQAVTKALRERYERLQKRRAKASVDELLAIAERAAAHVKRPYRDHAEFLYDERGLPK